MEIGIHRNETALIPQTLHNYWVTNKWIGTSLFLAKAWRILSYEANINMRSAAKHVMSCGKVLPVDQTKEKLNKFQVPWEKAWQCISFAWWPTKKALWLNIRLNFREMHIFQKNANITKEHYTSNNIISNTRLEDHKVILLKNI